MSQSKEGEVLYRKVSVKDRLPQDGNKHLFHLIQGVPSEDEGYKKYDMCYCIHPEQKRIVRKNCDWWLEPIPASKLIEDSMPSEEDFVAYEAAFYSQNQYYPDARAIHTWQHEWLKTKLTNKK